MTNRYRQNFQAGTASGVLANSGTTTITGTNFPTSISGYMPIVLNPGYYGSTNTNGGPEIVYLAPGGSSTIANVSARGQEGTAGTPASGNVSWVAGPLVSDYSLTNQFANGDFPSPTTSGQLFVSSGTASAGWVDGFYPSTPTASGRMLVSTSSGTNATTAWVRPPGYLGATVAGAGSNTSAITVGATPTLSTNAAQTGIFAAGYGSYLVIIDGTLKISGTVADITVGIGVNSTTAFGTASSGTYSLKLQSLTSGGGSSPFSASFYVYPLSPTTTYQFSLLTQSTAASTYLYNNQITAIGLF